MLRLPSLDIKRCIWRQYVGPSWTRLCRPPPACRRYATLTSLDGDPAPGSRIHGFTLRRRKHIPELDLTALDFLHDKTGAQYLHISRDDKNNVFSIGFKTNPPDATGVPHILEHTTLCGSERYPVRDPFFKMLRRSLSNFMNAYTSADHTSYPFATTNKQDFENLMSIYLDATLFPLLRENDFLQEGWRLGPENAQSSSKAESLPAGWEDMVFKGVVYNEMKGQMSDASYLFYVRSQNHLLPALGNSGGDPDRMTDLSYNELKKFHQTHYHPSNAKIYTYGDMSWEHHARQLDHYFARFETRNVDSTIKGPISLAQGPIYRKDKGPIDAMLDPSLQFKTSTSWMTGDTADVSEIFAMGVMSSLLLEGYGSPMYQSLVESGLGLDFTPNTGFDASSNRGIFSIGLAGVGEGDVPRVKEAIQKTLGEVHTKGFDASKIEGVLHQLELSLKHKTTDFGMSVLQRLESGWYNGVDPWDALSWNSLVQSFRGNLAKGSYLENLLQKYLLNDQTLTFTMEPSTTFNVDLASAEQSRLKSRIAKAVQDTGNADTALSRCLSREQTLLEEQSNAPDQDLSLLPTLRVSDIRRTSERKTTRVNTVGPVQVQWREAPTNGLSYFRAIHELDNLPRDLRMLLPLFSESIMRLGTRDKTMEELEDAMKLKTGGIAVGYHQSPSPYDFQVGKEGLSFTGYAFDGNMAEMYRLLQVLLHETHFDGPEAQAKILQLIQGEASGASDAIAGAGHSYAMRSAQAGLSVSGAANEQVSGLTQIQQVLKLSSGDPSQSLAGVISKLKEIQSFAIANSGSLRVAITCGKESLGANEALLARFLGLLPDSHAPAPSQLVHEMDEYSKKTFFPLPYQVSYTGAAVPTVPYVHPDGATLQILSQLLTHRHLHHEIREKGGAYGGGAFARGLGGTFGYYSYRDPNPQNTLRVVREAGQFARDKSWKDQDLQEAKLSTFQTVDAPQSVSDEGMTRFVSGIDEDMEQTRREQLLDVKKEDLKDAAQKYLVDSLDDMRTVVIGEKKDWLKADDWAVKHIELQQPDQTVE